MSSLPSFFQTSRPKGFHFIPRYYDPEKEALQQRIAMIRQELGLTTEEDNNYVRLIQRGTMTTYFRRKLRKRERSSNLMLVVILALLVWLAWFLFF